MASDTLSWPRGGGSGALPLEGITVVCLEQAVGAPLANGRLFDMGARDEGPARRRREQPLYLPAELRQATVPGEDGDLLTARSRWGVVRDDLPTTTPRHPGPWPVPLSYRTSRTGSSGMTGAELVVDAPAGLVAARGGSAARRTVAQQDTQTVSVRARGDVPADHTFRAALLAYASDMSILEPAFRAVGATRHGACSRLLSLTHTAVDPPLC